MFLCVCVCIKLKVGKYFRPFIVQDLTLYNSSLPRSKKLLGNDKLHLVCQVSLLFFHIYLLIFFFFWFLITLTFFKSSDHLFHGSLPSYKIREGQQYSSVLCFFSLNNISRRLHCIIISSSVLF